MTIKTLAIFDFDGTLFRSPAKPDWWPETGWWGNPKSLAPPCVPEKPGAEWWVSSTVEAAKKCIADPEVYTVLITGRLHDKFRTRLHALLTHAGLKFDEVHMLPGGGTLPFKLKVIGSLLKGQDVEKIDIWEDRSEHVGAFKFICDQLGKESEIHLVSTKSHALECNPESTVAKVAAKYLASIRKASVEVDLGKVPGIVGEYFDNIVDYSQRKGDKSYTEDLGVRDQKVVLSEVEKALKGLASRVESAKHHIPGWHGSAIRVLAYMSEYKPGYYDPIYNDEGELRNFASAEVAVDKSPRKGSPSFTLFEDGAQVVVDDVLDAGDSDFFHEPEVEADYFALVNELRHPGSSAREGEKSVQLYTARPIKDRKLFENASSIPTNLFLTTSYDEAEGYAMDMGERDIWSVHVKKKYLVETLDRGRLKNYQVVAPGGKVPVDRIERAS